MILLLLGELLLTIDFTGFRVTIKNFGGIPKHIIASSDMGNPNKILGRPLVLLAFTVILLGF